MTQIVVEGDRLAWYRDSAETPEFWERHWRVHPPVNHRNLPIPRWFAGQILKYLPRDGPVVEAGCGNGALVRCLVDHGFTVEGLDFAPAAVQANVATDPDGSYRVGDVREMPYADGVLAGYISLGVVEHFRDEQERGRILSEAHRCLRSGGILLISTPYYNLIRRWRAASHGFSKDPGAERFYQFAFSRRDLQSQLQRSGFHILDVDGYDVFKGIKDTIGGAEIMRRYAARSPRHAARLEHPPRMIRRIAAHMLLMVAVKPHDTRSNGS